MQASKCQCSKDFPEEPFAMLSGKMSTHLQHIKPSKPSCSVTDFSPKNCIVTSYACCLRVSVLNYFRFVVAKVISCTPLPQHLFEQDGTSPAPTSGGLGPVSYMPFPKHVKAQPNPRDRGNRELGKGTWDRELGQGTRDRELGTGNWDRELGTQGTGDRELGAGNWGGVRGGLRAGA